MKQGAIIEIAYDSQEWYPRLMTLMCGELENLWLRAHVGHLYIQVL
jgi:hypothetical protein